MSCHWKQEPNQGTDSRSQQPGNIFRLWAGRLLVSKCIETILKSKWTLDRLKIGLRTTLTYFIHIQFDFYSHKRNVPQNGERKFGSPNELLREILLTQTKFCCPWNKIPCEISHICTKFQWYGNNRFIELLTRIRFLRNIAQFGQILSKFAQYCRIRRKLFFQVLTI